MITKQPDFNDSLDDIFDANPKPVVEQRDRSQPLVDRGAPIHMPAPESLQGGFTEKCKHCRGTGRFTGFSGRVLGPCFKCDGKGEINFKTSPHARAKRHAASAKRSADRAAEKAAWFEQHKDLIRWMEKEADRFRTGKTSFDFIHKMAEAISEFGSLTEAQLAAVLKCKAKSDERRAAWQQQNNVAPVAIDCSKIETAFAKVINDAAEGDDFVRNLTLRFDGFKFTAGQGKWAGKIFVNSTTQANADSRGLLLGVVDGGKLQPRREATSEQIQAIQAVAADPAGAAKAFGLKFKFCACCGRELTNAESRERGIGPICAEKFGF